jgi:hypothetical protein
MLTEEDARFFRIFLRVIYSELYARHRSALHVLAEKTGYSPEHVEAEARRWQAENLIRLKDESWAEMERALDLVGRPSWWPGGSA